MPYVDLVAGDRTLFRRTCREKVSGDIVDLSTPGWVAVLLYRMDGGTLITRALVITSPGTAGVVEFKPGAGQEWIEGELVGEIELTNFAGEKFTELEQIVLDIRRKT